tara:strand:+ start:2981 stop:3226 length:246 start_codon:yes stop_codon:yes gene_type:complete
MKERIANAKANAKTKARELYSKRAELEEKAKPVTDFLNRHVDKALMGGLLVIELMQAESLDNIEDSSQVSAAVDYHDYTTR